MSTDSDPVFEARGLSKHFGHIEAVVDVSVAFRRGEITAIVGDNGAGKSTLVKMLTGALRPDEGEIVLNGENVVLHDPLDARKKGVEVVYQELARAAYWASSVVLMDEPTSALGLRESRAVLDLVKRIRDLGLAVGIISHALPHVAELADHLVVLRHGQKVSDLRHEDFSVPQIMQLILEGNPAATVGSKS